MAKLITQIVTDDAIAATPTIKSPVKSQKSEVISQNTIGTRRLEKFNGKCYLIDTSTVFGSNGMPQGSAQTCPGSKLMMKYYLIK